MVGRDSVEPALREFWRTLKSFVALAGRMEIRTEKQKKRSSKKTTTNNEQQTTNQTANNEKRL
jgi:hypothetical protein